MPLESEDIFAIRHHIIRSRVFLPNVCLMKLRKPFDRVVTSRASVGSSCDTEDHNLGSAVQNCAILN